ncbi:hypothetical protein CC78DRAFT_569183 [Lojkania enalia]|uniref:Glycoside hydrolase family 5 protein n=1 Tax=Lojkania enalia TaxID=147567 RepID=A0A9P4K8R5_9PLEO|nr:hypothetical protein CC78DRAFT_569183 [Didymosphaeria enalia]
MYFLNVLASLISVASLAEHASATLRITADHHSWGGVNYPSLQSLEPKERNEVIRAIVKSNARVIRLFIQGDEKYPDPEPEIGVFDRSMLDRFDDTLAAIHRISKGKVKVIVAPHNAHALRGSNNVPCDAYCKKIDGAFLDFYSNLDIRETYRTRLDVFFKHYPSKNFGGKPWSTLNEVILGVDVQNEPWSGIFPIVAGEPWLCDIATHLKDTIGLGKHNIAVITGGISGSQSPDGFENFPDCAFDCPAVDVISVHGYYTAKEDATAGTPWANMFLPGNTLTARALGKKLLLVEELAYVHNKMGLAYKKGAIWDQGNALNFRGIPWIYSHLTTKDEGTSSRVSILRSPIFAIGALADALKRAYTSRSNFDWSKYLAGPPALTNATELPLNPFTPEQSYCTFGCHGYLCDSPDGCAPDLMCKNSVCQAPAEKQPGKMGDECNSKAICQSHLRCEDGLCQQCLPRASKAPKRKRKSIFQADPNEQCELDTANPFRMRNICTLTPRGSPCQSAMHCSADEFCDWGVCKICTEGCLGMKCKSSNKCKTGYCNSYGRCDYPGQKKKGFGPGARARGRSPSNRGPKGQEGGPNKVWDVPVRVSIPSDGPIATGQAT